MDNNELQQAIISAATQTFDVTINPLAGMICTLLQLLISKEILSCDDAKRVIVSALDLINQSEHSAEVMSNGHDMLSRMLSAIDKLPKPST